MAPRHSKARVALVQAPVFDRSTPSNAIALLSAHLKRAGFSPIVHDAGIAACRALAARTGRDLEAFHLQLKAAEEHPELVKETLERCVDQLLAQGPDAVGFSVQAYTETWTLHMAERIKARAPKCLVFFGGAQCLRENLAFDFARHPAVDAVLVGESDVSIVEFARALKPGSGEAPLVPGALVKRNGQVVDGGPGPEVEDLDTLPYLDFSGFDMSAYDGDRLFMSTSRGCVRKCSFCTHIIQQREYRMMSPQRTVAEIKHHLERFPKRWVVEFNDSAMNGSPKRLAEISDLLVGLRAERLITHPGSDFAWTGQSILNPAMTFPLLQRLRRGGCRILRYGLESGSQKVVDLMRKQFKIEDAERIIRDTSRAGICAYLYFLVGYPGETEADFQMTLDFIKRNAKHIGGGWVSPCEIQKGSHLDTHKEDYDIRLPVDDPRRWVSKGGDNTPEVRDERVKKVLALLEELNLPISRRLLERTGDFLSVPEAA